MTPMKAIRAKCLDCCCGSFHEVRLCTAEKCPLYPYRFGKRPKRYEDTTPNTNSAESLDSPTVFEEAEGDTYHAEKKKLPPDVQGNPRS